MLPISLRKPVRIERVNRIGIPLILFTHPRKFNKPIKNPADYDGTRCYVIILTTLSVSLLLVAAAKKKLLYSLPQAFEEKQKRSLMVCMLAIVEITPR